MYGQAAYVSSVLTLGLCGAPRKGVFSLRFHIRIPCDDCGVCNFLKDVFKMSFVVSSWFTCLSFVLFYVTLSCWEAQEHSVQGRLCLGSYTHHGFTHNWQKVTTDDLSGIK